MTSARQVPRLLALVPYLRQHPDADLAETARVFGVTPRQLMGDLRVLWYCGLPGGMPGDLIEVDMDAVESEGRIRLSNADYLSRPLRLTLDEAMSLVVALRALAEMADTSTATAVQTALSRLEQLVGDADRVGLVLVTGADVIRDQLARAIEQGRAVRLAYHGASRGEVTQPVVEPAVLSTADGYAYLTAWAVERDAWRTYRLDRIASVDPTEEPVHDHGAPPVLESGWLDARPDAAEVTLDLRAEGAWVAEYVPVVEATPRPDGGVRLRLLVADPGWLRRLLLRLGPAVEAVDPAEAAASARAEAQEALARYATPER